MNTLKTGRWPVSLALFVLLSVFSLSCGPREVVYPESGATLEGVVKYGNEPVPFGMVIAVGETSATAMLNREGRYVLKNCPLGEVKLAVNTEAGRGDYMTLVMAGSQPGPDGKAKKTSVPKFIDVPKKFAEPMTSGLTTTVNKGNNTFDITIPK